jgi:hypothetical protein
MRLVPAEIVARADVNDADRKVCGGESATHRAKIERCSRGAQGGGLEEGAARKSR